MCAAARWCLQHTAVSKERAWPVWKQSREKEGEQRKCPARHGPDQSQAVTLSTQQVMGTLS